MFPTHLECSLFPTCSGCSTMGDVTLIAEKQVLEDFAQKNRIPISFRSRSPYGYRIRTKLPCRLVNGKIEFGLFKKGTHDLVPMPRCPLHTPKINEILPKLKNTLEKHNVIPFSESNQMGELRAIQLTDNRKGTLQLALSLLNRKRDLEPLFLDLLSLQRDLSLWVSIHPNPTSNTLFSNDWEHLGGERDFWIRFGKEDFPFHPGCFLQSNPNLFEDLLNDLEEFVPEKAKILDLFAGVGVIGSQFAQKASEVHLIETNPLCFEMFSLFNKNNKHPNLRFKTQGAEDLSILESYDVLIVDPPRKGLSKEFKESLLKSDIETVIYVSCGLHSLIRDAKDLAKSYQIADLKGYFLFPGTEHIETVAVFKR